MFIKCPENVYEFCVNKYLLNMYRTSCPHWAYMHHNKPNITYLFTLLWTFMKSLVHNYLISILVQDCCISSALAREILQSCTKPPTSPFLMYCSYDTFALVPYRYFLTIFEDIFDCYLLSHLFPLVKFPLSHDSSIWQTWFTFLFPFRFLSLNLKIHQNGLIFEGKLILLVLNIWHATIVFTNRILILPVEEFFFIGT